MDSKFIWSFTDHLHDHSYSKCSSAGIELETNTSPCISEMIKFEQPTSSEMKQEQISSEVAEVKLETAWSMASGTEIKQQSIEFDVEKTEVKLEVDLKTGRFFKNYQI